MSTYIHPSECQQCVPVETLTNDSGLTWTIETAHQTTCPNAPDRMNATEGR